MKKAVHYIITSLTVFIFGYLLMHSNDSLVISKPEKKESSKEVSYHFNQGKIDFNQEGTQKESISLKTNQSSSSNEIVRKQIPSFLIPNSFVQLELFNKNSFEVFFVKKNLLNLFLNSSRIIFPFHYFW